jgi:Caudovirus prohead serine protease
VVLVGLGSQEKCRVVGTPTVLGIGRNRDTRDQWDQNRTTRELLEIELMETSVVTFPAYPQTSIQARSLGLPIDAEIVTYGGLPAVTDGQREHLRLRLEFLRRL